MAKVEVTGKDEFPKELPFFGWILLALLLVGVVGGLYFGGRRFAYEVQRSEPKPRGNFAGGSQAAPAHGVAPAPVHGATSSPAAPATGAQPTPGTGAQPAPTSEHPAAGSPAAPAAQPHGSAH